MKYKYNGITLPKLPEWDKTAYPYAFIQFGDMTGYSIYSLIVTNSTGVMGDSYQIGAHTTCEWVVAADKESAENLSGTTPGISTDNWLQYENAKTHTEYGYSNVVWSDHEIRNADNSIYLPKSYPVPVYDMRSFWAGVSMGLCGKAIFSKKEPVAYLYNGVALPNLPDSEMQYAFMTASVSTSNTSHYSYYSTIYLYYSTVPIYVYTRASGSALKTKQDGNLVCYTCSLSSDGAVLEDWTRYENGDITAVADANLTGMDTDNIIWTNDDITFYNSDMVDIVVYHKYEHVPIGDGLLAYSGIILPKLPDWDKDAYPYAVILEDGGEYRLYCVDVPFSYGLFQCFIRPSANRIVYCAASTNWVHRESGTSESAVFFDKALWSNTDISPIHVYKPIPVYE